MDRKPTLAELLAYRDGTLDDAQLTAHIDADREARDALGRLERLRSELRDLPGVTPPPSAWEAIQERTAHRPRPWLQRFPLATAATVFLATALGILLWNPGGAPLDVAGGPQVDDPLAQLKLRSRQLESQLFTRASIAAAHSTSSEQALQFGIADVDIQLTALYESDNPDPAERERLWRQRVALLESLADVQRGQAVLRPAIY